jgi:transcriptional regulator with XRE-family HTH domain
LKYRHNKQYEKHMDKELVGKFLAAKRKEHGLTYLKTAHLIGCNPTTILRMENGISRITPRNVQYIAKAYMVDPLELAKLCGYPASVIGDLDQKSEPTVTADDLEFLLTLVRGNGKPMPLSLIEGLLTYRKK